jgi:hypothetical protein
VDTDVEQELIIETKTECGSEDARKKWFFLAILPTSVAIISYGAWVLKM